MSPTTSAAVQKGVCYCKSAIDFRNMSFFFCPFKTQIEHCLRFDVSMSLGIVDIVDIVAVPIAELRDRFITF